MCLHLDVPVSIENRLDLMEEGSWKYWLVDSVMHDPTLPHSDPANVKRVAEEFGDCGWVNSIPIPWCGTRAPTFSFPTG